MSSSRKHRDQSDGHGVARREDAPSSLGQLTSARRWIVRRSGFPFTIPGDPIGSVQASDRDVARQLAVDVYGPKVTVEPENALSPAEADPFPYLNPLKGAAAALAHASTAMRRMTAIEVQMARAVGVLRFPPAQFKGTIRRLHAESFKSAPEISDDLAKKLRSIVQATAKDLPRELMESVGGGS